MSEQLNTPRIRMTHPDIDGAFYFADPLQVPHLEEAGWQVADGEDDSAVERWSADLRRFEGQPKVRLRHPQIDGDPITVAESAVPYHRERGWLIVDSDDDLAARGAQYGDKTLDELKELARDRGLKVSGTKDELLARLREPYDRGSDLPTGVTEVVNSTGEPERVEPVDQAGDEPAQPEEE